MNIYTFAHIKAEADYTKGLSMLKSATVCSMIATAVMITAPVSSLTCLIGAGMLWLGYNVAHTPDTSRVRVDYNEDQRPTEFYMMPRGLAKIYNKVSAKQNPYTNLLERVVEMASFYGRQPIGLEQDAKVWSLKERAWEKRREETLRYIKKQSGSTRCTVDKNNCLTMHYV